MPDFVELTGSETALEKNSIPEIPVGVSEESTINLMELLDDDIKLAIEALPEDFRRTVIMADLQDMSYKEIAEKMRCPLGTVMSRLYRGRKALRKDLGEYARERHYGGE